jgi:hypothetical protein
MMAPPAKDKAVMDYLIKPKVFTYVGDIAIKQNNIY